MGNYCVPYGCKNRAERGNGISFLRFPHSDRELLVKWMNSMKRKDWKKTKNTFLCGQHNEKSCFVVLLGKTGHRLNPGAVLPIFPAFPEH